MSFLSLSSRDALAALAAATQPLTRLAAVRAAAAALDADPAALAAVRESLTAGATWDDIALAAGVKPAAAKWRWLGSDDEIAARAESGRKRSARPSSVPTDLPGYSVAEAAKRLGVTAQAVYLRISRGQLDAETVRLADGRSYRRVKIDPATDVAAAVPPVASGNPPAASEPTDR